MLLTNTRVAAGLLLLSCCAAALPPPLLLYRLPPACRASLQGGRRCPLPHTASRLCRRWTATRWGSRPAALPGHALAVAAVCEMAMKFIRAVNAALLSLSSSSAAAPWHLPPHRWC